MARNKEKGSGKSQKGMIGRCFKFFTRSFGMIFFIVLGGLLFNLDRMEYFGVTLLKYKNFLPSPIVYFLPGGNAGAGQALPEQEIDGEIIEVYDGDTVTLLTDDNKKYKVRFYGIDAPEAAQTYGLNSRDALREKILGKKVTVKVVSIDRYGRVVCRVICGDRYINLEMVSSGMAWYYADYAKNEYDLALAEKEARQRAAGLWQNPNPQPPWQWRKANKNN